MERLEIAFYESALSGAGLTGELREYGETALGHEREHETYLEGTLGSTAGIPRLKLARTVADPRDFTRRAIAMEDILVSSRNGQAGNLSSQRPAEARTLSESELADDADRGRLRPRALLRRCWPPRWASARRSARRAGA